MKKSISALLLAGALSCGFGLQAQELLAFPGAEGFGRYATGGRGGEIYHVTNLNDSGTGSFRDAVSKSGRIIVFDVCGTINLKSALVVKGGNTILGQTAPGEGIQVYGNRVSFSGADNLIVRHMRFRMGTPGDSGKDACGIANGENMIFDHLSVLWGKDENFSVSWDNKGTRPGKITIQNSIIGQGLQSHSCGGLIQTDGGVTLYRNLYIENKTRNPKVKGVNQYVNNVVYNWGDGGGYIMGDTEGASWAHIENNYFMRGPWPGTQPFTRGSEAFHYYGAGNYFDNNKDGVLNGDLLTVEQMNGKQSDGRHSTWVESLDALNNKVIHEVIHEGTGSSINYDVVLSEQDRTIPIQIPAISNVMTAAEAYAWMTTNVGPCLPAYDDVDQYIIDEFCSYGKTGTYNGISNETTQLPHKGTGNLSGGVKPADSDGDGIPDAWEIANGLNPNDASDAKAIAANGYANIENYSFTITEAYPYIKKPIKLAVTRQGKTELDLTWDVNKNTTNGFKIETSTDNGSNWTEAAQAPAGTTAYTLTGLTPETGYKVRVRAYNNDGIYSDYTDVVTTETVGDPSAPKVSTNPFPANGAKEGIAAGLTLKWENSTKSYDGTVKYTVYLGQAADAMTAVATDITAKEYKTTDLQANKTYYWRVDAKNDIGTTEGTLWTFSTTAGGVLFYSDFFTQPEGWAAKYGDITANTNILNSANATASVGGMTFGTGSTAIRIIAMNGANMSDDTSKDYGPATAEDAGASVRCVQFYTTAAGGYLLTPEVTGPCVVTLYLGNPDTKAKTVKLYTKAGGQENLAQELKLGSKKRIYKFTYTYTGSGTVQFKIDNNAVKFNINDLLIERYIAPGEEPIELTDGNLVNDNLSYADGSLTLTFNQDVLYKGGAQIDGKTQWEKFDITTAGKKLTIAYDALNVNTDYTITFPAGSITNLSGSQSFTTQVKINTCDFPALKADGETHFGKAAASLPISMAPFNAVAPFATVGGLVQEKQNDYPHWIQASGTVSENLAELTSTSDKIMAYFEPESKYLVLKVNYSGTGNPVLKVLESRNCDITPGWRTIRTFETKDFPINACLPLNSETHFVKLLPVTIGGSLNVTEMRVSDATGFLGDDFDPSALSTVASDALAVTTLGGVLTVSGVPAGETVTVYDIAGHAVAVAEGDASFTLAGGFYIVSVDGCAPVKVKL